MEFWAKRTDSDKSGQTSTKRREEDELSWSFHKNFLLPFLLLLPGDWDWIHRLIEWNGEKEGESVLKGRKRLEECPLSLLPLSLGSIPMGVLGREKLGSIVFDHRSISLLLRLLTSGHSYDHHFPYPLYRLSSERITLWLRKLKTLVHFLGSTIFTGKLNEAVYHTLQSQSFPRLSTESPLLLSLDTPEEGGRESIANPSIHRPLPPLPPSSEWEKGRKRRGREGSRD